MTLTKKLILTAIILVGAAVAFAFIIDLEMAAGPVHWIGIGLAIVLIAAVWIIPGAGQRKKPGP